MTTKNKILSILSSNTNEPLSGEEIAKNLNISRNAVWKAISTLRKEGYLINATTNKGYTLIENQDILSEIEIRKNIDSNFNGDIITFKTIDSTNKFAKKLKLDNFKDFVLIVSEEQTNGKGRLGKSFYSPNSSGIYMSLIIKPNLSFNDAVLITTSTSVSICKAVKKLTNIDLSIKWVNDLLLNEKKVCGILTEAITNFESGTLEFIIIGIGLNFKEPKTDFPEELKDIASYLLDSSENLTRNILISEILNEILYSIPNLEKREFIEEYKKRSIIIGNEITYIIKNQKFDAKAIDIDNNGALIVLDYNTNKILTLNSAEISIKKK